MNRIDEIKRRHKLRKKITTTPTSNKRSMPSFNRQEPHQHPTPPSGHPLFNANLFILKCFLAAILVLGSVILYRTNLLSAHPKAKDLVQTSLTKEFNFSMVSGWYEKTFGEPLALLPLNKGNKEKVKGDSTNQQLTEPVSGTVTESFTEAKKGITFKTASNAEVDAIDSGLVISVGDKEGIGKTVVIQHENGDESWYGKLNKVNVKLYDSVKQGQKIGTVTQNENGKEGIFYFALKDGDQFIDPIQVIAH